MGKVSQEVKDRMIQTAKDMVQEAIENEHPLVLLRVGTNNGMETMPVQVGLFGLEEQDAKLLLQMVLIGYDGKLQLNKN